MALSYYISIMVAQLIIGRPSSTWILGVFWLPIFVLKPGLIGFLIGSLAWLFIRPFHLPRPLAPTEIKAFKIFLAFLLVASATAGFIKILRAVAQ